MRHAGSSRPRWALGPGLALALAACSGSAPPSGPATAPVAHVEPVDDPVETDDPSPDSPAQASAQTPEEPAAEPEPAPPVEDPWLRDLLAARPQRFGTVLEDPARYRLQILVTVIQPGADGPTVVEHPYRVDAEYVYPASAIKTFAAVGALKVLAELRGQGHRVGLDTPLAYCEGEKGPCDIETDDSNVDSGTITVGHEIRKMQLVSNNVSFNRLYELVGHRELNEMMWAMGFSTLRVQHRMYGVKDPAMQRITPRIELRPRRGKKVLVPRRVSDLEMPPAEFDELELGIAYIDDALDERVETPLDFSTKNYVSIRDLHALALAIARPGLPGVPDLKLTKKHRAHLVAAMADNPAESDNPVYPDMRNGLRYKTMIGGMSKVVPLPRIRYVGKAGRAYGFHLDNAYVEDRQTHRAMAITVVIYANENRVLNDNVYEYDGVTRPFLKALGRTLAQAVFVDGSGV